MLRRLFRFAVLLCALLIPAWAAAADDSREGGGRATPGAVAGTATDVTLQDFDGKTRHTSEFIGQGKWTVVTVWSADCPICKAEIFHMTFLHDEHKGKDLAVLGLSIDGPENRAHAQRFIDDQGLNFPNLIGTPDDASELSGTMFIGTPTYYFFSPEGELAGLRIGPLTQDLAERTVKNLKAERADKKS